MSSLTHKVLKMRARLVVLDSPHTHRNHEFEYLITNFYTPPEVEAGNPSPLIIQPPINLFHLPCDRYSESTNAHRQLECRTTRLRDTILNSLQYPKLSGAPLFQGKFGTWAICI